MHSSISGNHILVGLGGTGGKILRAFKMRIFEEFPSADERKKLPISLLYVDSTDEMMPKEGRPRADFRVMGQDASFTSNEFLNIKAVDIEAMLSHINNYPSVKGIVENVGAVRSAIGSLGEAAGQKRRAGRLLFAANAVGYVNSLRNAYYRAQEVSGTEDRTTFYIFAGLAGGTGSGSIVDAIVQTRKAYPYAKILAFVMMPEMNLPKSNMDQGRYYQNGYAALNELNALQAGRWNPQDVTGNGPIALYNDRIHGVANGLMVYSNVNENGLSINSLEELPKIVGDYTFARIFDINDEHKVNEDFIRAFNFENMDDFAIEYDETANRDANGAIPVARTKKVNSFGIKRVVYPELRVLKHITYTVGESILLQFKYNNWTESQGFIAQERNKDYRREYFTKEKLRDWLLDEEHLTLESKILPDDADYPDFAGYWHDKAIGYAEDAKKSNDPLNELDNILADFYTLHFRESGVEKFYEAKEKVLPEMAREVRRTIEHELFAKWRQGDISIIELQKVSKLLLERAAEIRAELDTAYKEEVESYKQVDEDRKLNVEEWSHLNLMQRAVGQGSRRFADHQSILSDYYTSKTRLVALNFAKKLAARIAAELGKMDLDISTFSDKVNLALEETERLVAAQRKVNKGLEDMRGAIIEVSEEDAMKEFEVEIRTDKVEMPNIATALRETILPKTEFVNFGLLADDIDIDGVRDAFDITLSEIVRRKHNDKATSDNKVLGLNILTQLQQQLKTDDDIKAFAAKIVKQSGAFTKLSGNEVTLHLRNNEGNLSPSNPASINKKVILVNIPSPDKSESLKRFADKLKTALQSSFNQGSEQTTITLNTQGKRQDELSILTIRYCYPIRAIEWMRPYKLKYDNFLHTGNPNTDANNAILLHSEGDGSQLPSLFAVENAEQIAAQQAAAAQPQAAPAAAAAPAAPAGAPVPPPLQTAPEMPPMPPIPAAEPEISLHLAVAGQQYGPFNREQCKQMVTTGQLTPATTVWMAGMAAWAAAGTVDALKSLFAPTPPPAVPGMPPMPPMPPAM